MAHTAGPARPLTNAAVGAALRTLGMTKAVTRTIVDVHGYGRRTSGDYTLQSWGEGAVRVTLTRSSSYARDRALDQIRELFEGKGRTVEALPIGGLVLR